MAGGDPIREEAWKGELSRRLEECKKRIIEGLSSGQLRLDDILAEAERRLEEDKDRLNVIAPGFLGTLQAILRFSRGYRIDEKTLEKIVYDQLISDIYAQLTEVSSDTLAGIDASGVLLVNPLFYICLDDPESRISVLAHEAAHILLGHHTGISLLPVNPFFLNVIYDAYIDSFLRSIGFKKLRAFVTMKDVALNTLLYDRLVGFLARHLDEIERIAESTGDPVVAELVESARMAVRREMGPGGVPPVVMYFRLAYLLDRYGGMLSSAAEQELRSLLVDAAREAERLENMKLNELVTLVCSARRDVCDIPSHLASLAGDLMAVAEWGEPRSVLEEAARGEARKTDVLDVLDTLNTVLGSLLESVLNDAALLGNLSSADSVRSEAAELYSLARSALEKLSRLNDVLSRVARRLESGAAAGDEAREALREWESLSSLVSSIASKALHVAAMQRRLNTSWATPQALDALSRAARRVASAIEALKSGDVDKADSELLGAASDARRAASDSIGPMAMLADALSGILESSARDNNVENKEWLAAFASRLIGKMLKTAAVGVEGDPRDTLMDAEELARDLEAVAERLTQREFEDAARAVGGLVSAALSQSMKAGRASRTATSYMQAALDALARASLEQTPSRRREHLAEAIEYIKKAIEALAGSGGKSLRLSELADKLASIYDEYVNASKHGQARSAVLKRLDEILEIAEALGVEVTPTEVVSEPDRVLARLASRLAHILKSKIIEYEELRRGVATPGAVHT